MKLHSPNLYITLMLTYHVKGPVLNVTDDQTQPCKDTATPLNILKHDRKQWFRFCNFMEGYQLTYGQNLGGNA